MKVSRENFVKMRDGISVVCSGFNDGKLFDSMKKAAKLKRLLVRIVEYAKDDDTDSEITGIFKEMEF